MFISRINVEIEIRTEKIGKIRLETTTNERNFGKK